MKMQSRCRKLELESWILGRELMTEAKPLLTRELDLSLLFSIYLGASKAPKFSKMAATSLFLDSF